MRSLTVAIVTPAPPGSQKGNRVTAERWSKLLQQLGHQVQISESYPIESFDVLIALHARKSHAAIQQCAQEQPDCPLIVTLTGTDLYEDIKTDANAQESLQLADRLMVLQQKAVESLPAQFQSKARVIYQSVTPPADLPEPPTDRFDICVVGHLREVKDPFRAAEAIQLLPADSKIRLLQLGGSLNDAMAERAQQEMKNNPHYQWLGEVPWDDTLRTIARCKLMVLTSKLEGGANAVGEALICGTPVISSAIDGSIGMLGEDYPGYFPVGDTQALADLLHKAETDNNYYSDLKSRCNTLKEQFRPEREKQTWANVLDELLTY